MFGLQQQGAELRGRPIVNRRLQRVPQPEHRLVRFLGNDPESRDTFIVRARPPRSPVVRSGRCRTAEANGEISKRVGSLLQLVGLSHGARVVQTKCPGGETHRLDDWFEISTIDE